MRRFYGFFSSCILVAVFVSSAICAQKLDPGAGDAALQTAVAWAAKAVPAAAAVAAVPATVVRNPRRETERSLPIPGDTGHPTKT